MILIIFGLLKRIFGERTRNMADARIIFICLLVLVLVGAALSARCAYVNYRTGQTAEGLNNIGANLSNANLNASIANQTTRNANAVSVNANLQSKQAETNLNAAKSTNTTGTTGSELDRMAKEAYPDK